jgi:hypothetical protein
MKDNSSEQVEHIKGNGQPNGNGLVMPASLAALGAEQYQKLGKRATLKLDLM